MPPQRRRSHPESMSEVLEHSIRERLPAKLKLSWGVGAIGTTSMLYLISMFLVYFMVRHLNIEAATAGLIISITRLFDAIINPLVGNLSDRSSTRWGRRRPWMMLGAVLCPIACVALFTPPAVLTGRVLEIYMLGVLIIYFSAYTLFSIPYMALGSEMTDDYAERASVMGYRAFFVYLSGIVVMAGAPALISALGSDRAAYSMMSWAVAVALALTMLSATLLTGSAKITVRAARELPWRQWLSSALANRPYLILILAKTTLQIGTAFSGAAALFFMVYVLGRGESALALFGFSVSVAGAAAVPLWSRILHRWERRPVFMFTLAVYGVACLSWLAAGPNEPDWIFVSRCILVGAFGSGALLISLAMLTDTIEYDRLRTGQRREGLFVGGYEFMQTTSFVVAPLVIGLAFGAAGLKSGAVLAADQPDSALAMIRGAMAVVPAASCAIGILLLLAYHLSARELRELRERDKPTDWIQAAVRG